MIIIIILNVLIIIIVSVSSDSARLYSHQLRLTLDVSEVTAGQWKEVSHNQSSISARSGEAYTLDLCVSLYSHR